MILAFTILVIVIALIYFIWLILAGTISLIILLVGFIGSGIITFIDTVKDKIEKHKEKKKYKKCKIKLMNTIPIQAYKKDLKIYTSDNKYITTKRTYTIKVKNDSILDKELKEKENKLIKINNESFLVYFVSEKNNYSIYHLIEC